MNTEDQPIAAGPLTEDEQRALELRWDEGRLLQFADWLFAFVDGHREEILLLAGTPRDPVTLLAATKQLIARQGSLHMAAEMKDQRREIENEIRSRGEKGEHDRAGIQQEWTARHAAAWRRWRIREYLFVVDRSADRLAARLLPKEQGLLKTRHTPALCRPACEPCG